MRIRKKSFYKNFFIHYISIILISILILFFITYSTIRNVYNNHLKEELINHAKLIELLILNNNQITLENHISNIKNLHIHTEIHTNKYKKIFELGKKKSIENYNTLPYGYSKVLDNNFHDNILVLKYPVYKLGSISHYIILEKNINTFSKIMPHYRFQSTLLVLIFTIIAALLSFFMAKKFVAPLKKISLASKKVALGDFQIRLLLNTNDEINELADSFNNMTLRLEELFFELNSEKEEIERIIESIEEGILVIDSIGKVKKANNSLKIMIDNDDIIGKYYWEIFKQNSIIKMIKNVNEKKKNVTKNRIYKGRNYLCSSNFINGRNEVVVVFYDITEIKQLERLKKDFVSNVSHELKTPLTAIKGFVETLSENEQTTENKRYLSIINRHTDRMINIVDDLLTLSEIEDKGNENIELSKINLEHIFENLLNMFEDRLKNKNLEFSIEIDKNSVFILADPCKLEELFINLIDNAIKYTDQGKIYIKTCSTDNLTTITIGDTGIGIQKDKMNRIFERFYVVDKSRSRKTGGTGLGLSIVKHIALLHNWEIDVESKYGLGTEFLIKNIVNSEES